MEAIQKITDYIMSQVGYLEKASSKDLDNPTASAGYNNYTKYGAYFGHNGPDAYWCDYFIDYCFCQVFGREKAVQLLDGLSGYTPTSAAGVVRNGGAVALKEYPIINARIAGYGRPDYSLAESVEYTEGWRRAADGVRWWYQYADGSYAADRWLLLNHHWYLFDREGYLCTGWHRWDGKACDPEDGGGDWYFLDNTAGGPLEGACWRSRENGAQEIWYVA